jgi:two-component system, OmpR family, sensor histidine kinase KdpD
VVAFVETPGHTHMPPASHERVVHNLSLAEQLGAHVEYLVGTTVSQAVIDYARRNNITKIIAGKPLRPRLFELLRGGSVIDHIMRESGSIDIYVISEEKVEPLTLPPTSHLLKRRWGRYVSSLILVGFVTAFSALLLRDLEPTNLVMFYLAAVVISAVYLGRGPSIIASLASVLVFDFFFIHPYFSFTVTDTEYIVTFVALLAVGLIISSSASLLRDQVDQLKKRENNARVINSLSKELTGAVSLGNVLGIVERKISQTFECDVAILLPERSELMMRASTNGLTLDPNELAVAEWTFHNRQPAGRGTETLPAAAIRCLPLETSHGIVGVLGIRSVTDEHLSEFNDRLLLENFSNLAALAIERALFAEQAALAESLRVTENLQSALLNSISHELRTPLSSIMGVLTSLEEDEADEGRQTRLNHETRLDLMRSASEQTRQLNHLVGNLLDMTRIQSGSVSLKQAPVDIQDLVGAILNQMETRLKGRPVEVHIPEGFPTIRLDTMLFGQAIINLLDNAEKFSPKQSPIEIQAALSKDEIQISVRDHGQGVPADELEKIFDKFFRGSNFGAITGTGLGLSICRGIVEAHKGRIWAENCDDGGLKVTIALPIDCVDTRE